MADFTQAVEIVMRREGGFSDEPADRGGKTMYGISQRQYPDLDIGNLTEEQAREIYRRDYWQDEFNEIALQKIAEKLFDGAVNLGKATSVRLLQQALCDIQFTVTIDGRFGAQTLLAAARRLALTAGAVLRGYRAEGRDATRVFGRLAQAGGGVTHPARERKDRT
jgi:lysozyme family protein